MALKFLNKKGWHTGSLRNIENVWKAEQKHEAEQKKLEELKKQIHEERERAEFRQLQEQAGLIPKQERLDFLYESGLAVGKGGSSFKELDSLPKTEPEAAAPSSSSAKQQSGVPGALFEEKEKPQSANDSWRKLHSDPLLLIRQREQEALARVKNNPIQMAMIRKSVEAKKDKGKDKDKDEKKHKKKHHKKKSKHRKHSVSENDSDSEDASLPVEKHRDSHHRGSKSDNSSRKTAHNSDEELSEGDAPRKKYHEKEYKDRRPSGTHNPKYDQYDDQHQSKKRSYDSQRREYSSEHRDSRDDKRSRFNSSDEPPRKEPNNRHYDSQNKEYSSEHQVDSREDKQSHSSRNEPNNRHYDSQRDDKQSRSSDKPPRSERNNWHYDSRRKEYSSEHSRDEKQSHFNSSDKPPRNETNNRHRNPVKISEEERAARLREMQMDAERHEEQRWKRLKKAAESDAEEAVRDRASMGRNFLDATQKSVYGAEKGGSSTIEESVRRRTHYLQRRSTGDTNDFRRS